MVITDTMCPCMIAQRLMQGKWSIIIMYYLSKGPVRFNELQRKLPKMTHATLSKQLKQLEGKQAAAQEKAKSVEKALLDKYAVVKKHCVPPVARLYGDQCGGCNMSLPQVTLRKFKNDVLYIECENCGRMIIQ